MGGAQDCEPWDAQLVTKQWYQSIISKVSETGNKSEVEPSWRGVAFTAVNRLGESLRMGVLRGLGCLGRVGGRRWGRILWVRRFLTFLDFLHLRPLVAGLLFPVWSTVDKTRTMRKQELLILLNWVYCNYGNEWKHDPTVASWQHASSCLLHCGQNQVRGLVILQLYYSLTYYFISFYRNVQGLKAWYILQGKLMAVDPILLFIGQVIVLVSCSQTNKVKTKNKTSGSDESVFSHLGSWTQTTVEENQQNSNMKTVTNLNICDLSLDKTFLM